MHSLFLEQNFPSSALKTLHSAEYCIWTTEEICWKDSHWLFFLIGPQWTNENMFLLQSIGVTCSPLDTYSYTYLAPKASDFPVSWLSDSDMLFEISSRLLFHVHERSVLSQGTLDLKSMLWDGWNAVKNMLIAGWGGVCCGGIGRRGELLMPPIFS